MTKSVLGVEDEPTIILSLEFLVEEAGYIVRVVRDGEEAPRAAEWEKGPTLGADDYVTKPFSTRELAQRLKQIHG